MHESKNEHLKMNETHYLRLLIMIILSFVSMYVLMYSMVDTFDNIYSNLNQLYMASLMTAPMVIIEVYLMGSMYKIKKWNTLIIAVSIIALIGSFALIRQQTVVDDEQFLRSMISHHASAILMCEQASIEDPEIQELCREIISGQQLEIEQMKAKLSQGQPGSLALIDVSTGVLIVSLSVVLLAYFSAKTPRAPSSSQGGRLRPGEHTAESSE